MHFQTHCIIKRRYPELKVGNEVRVMIKKTTFRKQTDNKWTSDKYKVIAIEDRNSYKLEERHSL